MKKLIILLLSFSYFAQSQSTLITDKALVLPQYPGELAAMVGIPSPTNGMLVFNNSLAKLMTYEPISNTWNNVMSSLHVDNRPSEIFRIRNENSTGSSNGIFAETRSVGGGSAVYGIATITNPLGDSYGIKGENRSLNSNGVGVYGLHRGNGIAIFGDVLGSGIAVKGLSPNGTGVIGISITGTGAGGISNSGDGVSGTSVTANGVSGTTDSGLGTYGYASGLGTGIYGVSNLGTGGYFQSNTSTALRTGTGNIGLGGTPNLNPFERIDINGRVRVRHQTQTAGIWFNNSYNDITDNDGAFFGMEIATAGSEKAGIYIGNAWRFSVDRSGNACFGGTLLSNGACTPSDFRYKKNIEPLSNSLQNLLKINGVSYVYRNSEFPEKQFSDKNQIGFIAQEIEKIYPEMVFTDEKGYKSVDYARITPVLVEALKEQQKEIENLKKIITNATNEIQIIKNMLQAQNGK